MMPTVLFSEACQLSREPSGVFDQSKPKTRSAIWPQGGPTEGGSRRCVHPSPQRSAGLATLNAASVVRRSFGIEVAKGRPDAQ
jgi:hypothetical protein